MLDLRPFLRRVRGRIDAHRLGSPGVYRRFWRADLPGAGPPEANPYGCADAANLLYTLGDLPRSPEEREGFVRALQGFQEPLGGLFREGSHDPVHTTAHCLGALELFEAGPRHRLAALAGLEAPEALERFLDELDWAGDPWIESHRGAGVYAARVLAGEASSGFQERYFAWLAAACDPHTGLWRRGCVAPPFRWGDNRFPHLAGTFHYLFNHEWARHPHPHPAALVDTCLDLFATQEYPLGASLGFAEIDWVYCLARAAAQSAHRPDEVRAALDAFAERYVAGLDALEWDTDDGANDLHRLFGAVCALAELQRALPGRLRSEVPLRLVLDRRPFI